MASSYSVPPSHALGPSRRRLASIAENRDRGAVCSRWRRCPHADRLTRSVQPGALTLGFTLSKQERHTAIRADAHVPVAVGLESWIDIGVQGPTRCTAPVERGCLRSRDTSHGEPPPTPFPRPESATRERPAAESPSQADPPNC